MNSLDIYIAIPVIIGFISGLFKGLIKEVIGFLILIAGIFFARIFDDTVSDFFIRRFDMHAGTAEPLAFIVVFALIAILLSIIGKMIERGFDTISLSGVNKLLGGVFGALKYALIISIFLNLLEGVNRRFTLIEQEKKEASLLYNPVLQMGPDLWKKAKGEADRQKSKEADRDKAIEDKIMQEQR